MENCKKKKHSLLNKKVSIKLNMKGTSKHNIIRENLKTQLESLV